jgi:hypothetical protein
MEIEDRIRTQIEAILVNDARNFTEIRRSAAEDEPLEAGELEEERNLYHRIIHSYKNAINEVNKLLEQNIESLSGFYRIVESIKEKEDFQEICSQIVHCILQSFGPDYCSLLFPEDGDRVCVEGICEDRKFLRIHRKESLLGSKEFEGELIRMANESGGCLSIEDVYKEPRFNSVDFPAVVRSILCLPITLRNAPVGFLVLSHSLPKFFHDNHIRVLKVLGSIVAHLRLLHQTGRMSQPTMLPADSTAGSDGKPDAYSIVLMEFDTLDEYGRRVQLAGQFIREIRLRIQKILEAGECVLFYGEKDLLVFLPGTSSESLPGRVRALRECFNHWRSEKSETQQHTRISQGFSVCEGEQDLSRTLAIASVVMHPESDEEMPSPDGEVPE